MSTISPLEKVGLTKKEADLYLALLSLGSATAYKIAIKSGIKRPTAYVLLEELREKGLVLKVPHAKKQLFIARDIEEYLEDREKEILEARRFASSLTRTKTGVPNVLYFEGEKGVREARYYKLPKNGSINRSIYGHVKSDKKLLNQYVDWHHEMMERDIEFRILVSKENLSKYFKEVETLSKEYSRYQVRTSKSFDFPENISIEIERTLVRINYADLLESVVIENEKMVEVHKQLFDIAWENSKKII